MPTKDERIATLEREVESLKEQLKFCRRVAEQGQPKTEILKEIQPTTGNASSETQPAASSTEPSETKQS